MHPISLDSHPANAYKKCAQRTCNCEYTMMAISWMKWNKIVNRICIYHIFTTFVSFFRPQIEIGTFIVWCVSLDKETDHNKVTWRSQTKRFRGKSCTKNLETGNFPWLKSLNYDHFLNGLFICFSLFAHPVFTQWIPRWFDLDFSERKQRDKWKVIFLLCNLFNYVCGELVQVSDDVVRGYLVSTKTLLPVALAMFTIQTNVRKNISLFSMPILFRNMKGKMGNAI